jgi:hypothetical protein
LAIREISAVIRVSRLLVRLFEDCAPILLRGILNIAKKAKREAQALASPNPIASKLEAPALSD